MDVFLQMMVVSAFDWLGGDRSGTGGLDCGWRLLSLLTRQIFCVSLSSVRNLNSVMGLS